MEAIIFDKKTLTLKYEKSKEKPKLVNENDVIVKVEYSGICGTDLHIIEGAFPCNDKNPFTLGHEFCGVIDSVGSKTHFKPGQRVAVDPNSGCGVCKFCHTGKYHLCEDGGINTTIGIWKDGGWAKYCRVPDTQLFLMPDDVTFAQGAFSEPLSCVAHGWDRAGNIAIGDDILVIGAGIIGNLWSSVLHLNGHKNVTVSEINKIRLDTAKKIGLGYKYLTPSEINDSKKKFDVIIDCSGVAKAFEASLSLLKRSGRYLVFGCSNPNDDVKINPFEIYMRESTIIGSNINPFTFPKALGLIQSMGDRYLDYNKLGIAIYPLSKYQEAIDELKLGKYSKVIFKM